MTDVGIYISPSRSFAVEARPGLIIQNSRGRVSWAEFEPAIERIHNSPLPGPRYLFLNQIMVANPRDLPDEEFRRRVGERVREASDRIAAFAYVIPIHGFLSATVHAIIAGITATSRAPHPERAFSAALPAAEWLTRQLPLDLGPAQIVARLDALVERQARAD